ncbi:hypothetical protein E4U57_002992 [Claviceps arundinis]|uniref:Aminoglycoside phosphotransferase domain-containing protein n=1 Tax=Claviceps arundinis TaxID=1623583 RepID=A0ABQ7PBH3_9HYPO|nr:hypothetical protein E4U57_002992 [Claviceps arundinis]
MAPKPSNSRVNKTNQKPVSARYNLTVLRGLEAMLLKEPESDISTALSSAYSKKLQWFKDRDYISHSHIAPLLPDHDIRRRLDENEPVTTIFSLSTEVEDLCHDYASISEAIIGLLDNSEVLYESPWAASVMVFRINENIVVKAGHESFSITEHQTLTYLQEHMPEFPAPRPHGLLRLGIHCFLFTSYIPGMNLEDAWPELNCSQKQDISRQIDLLFSKLRSFSVPEHASLGDVAGGGCRDLRRAQRVSAKPIKSVAEFEDFIFEGSDTATPVYVEFLRGLMPLTNKIVFTHGDIRPANIMVRREDGKWTVTAIIDWEDSGFYPEYWDAIKTANLLTSREDFDWYKYIPQSISQNQFSVPWLVDRLWDRCTTNG